MHLLNNLVLLSASCFASPISSPQTSPNHQARGIRFAACPERAQAVREAFRFAWNGYYKHAFPNDELKPVSRSFDNTRNGWGASAVDALSTAIIMEYDDIVEIILDHVRTIDWYKPTNPEVSVFETTIRYLGGMLSGYDLLKGPYAHLVKDQSKVNTLLWQAKALADALSPAFRTDSGIPDNNINIITGEKLSEDHSTGLAVAGTLVLEWTRLSDLLGDPYYAELVQNAESYLLQPQYIANFSEPFPGLQGDTLDYTSGVFTSVNGGWNGGSDSFYEYLIKQYIYNPDDEDFYRQRWEAAAGSTLRYLSSSPSSRPDLTFVAAYDFQGLNYESTHLAGFIGGNFLLGGLVLGNDEYIQAGLAFTKAWHETYIRDTPRIGPEAFQWLPQGCSVLPSPSVPTCTDSRPDIDFWDPRHASTLSRRQASFACTVSPGLLPQSDFYARSGFFVTDGSYELRPEVLESYYYAYRVTGDRMYQDWAWDAFTAINSSARIGSGFSSFRGLNGGGKEPMYDDLQESFLFAEVMKYAYIIFAGVDAEWHVNARSGRGCERWVFNTEAHPLKVKNNV